MACRAAGEAMSSSSFRSSPSSRSLAASSSWADLSFVLRLVLPTVSCLVFLERCTIFMSRGSCSISVGAPSITSSSLSASTPGTGSSASSMTPSFWTCALRSSSSRISCAFDSAISAIGPNPLHEKSPGFATAPPGPGTSPSPSAPPSLASALTGEPSSSSLKPPNPSSSSLSTSTPYFAPSALGLVSRMALPLILYSSSSAASISSNIAACSASASRRAAAPKVKFMVLVPPGLCSWLTEFICSTFFTPPGLGLAFGAEGFCGVRFASCFWCTTPALGGMVDHDHV
mmetsp:Transcript_3673/g.7650  ORF Transcript_3673/g.7650 Transcript_3673/m.7650 type:complete len:287 (+) Transcript_3673:1199-2059(+)